MIYEPGIKPGENDITRTAGLQAPSLRVVLFEKTDPAQNLSILCSINLKLLVFTESANHQEIPCPFINTFTASF
jgi:hypothetical protein